MNDLGINDFSYHENHFVVEGNKYKVTDIIELSKQYEPFDLPIKGIDISIRP